MSANPMGPGWWQASDGQWYPPHLAPGAQAPVPPPNNTGKVVAIVLAVVLGGILLLGIGAAVVVFAVGNTTDTAQKKACTLELREIKTALEAYKAAKPPYLYPTYLGALVATPDNPNGFLAQLPAWWRYTQTNAGQGYELDGTGKCLGNAYNMA